MLTGDRHQRFWDAYWIDRQATLTARTMTQVLDRIKLEYLCAILPAAGTTLEVGAGSGRLSCLLAMAGYRTVCLDSSNEALQAARINYETIRSEGRFVAGDGGVIPRIRRPRKRFRGFPRIRWPWRFLRSFLCLRRSFLMSCGSMLFIKAY